MRATNVWGFRQKEGAGAAVRHRLPAPGEAENRPRSLGRLYRHRDAGDFHLDRTEVVPAGEIQGFPVVAAEGNVGRRRRAMHDAAELLAARIDDPDPARAAAIDVAFDI